MVGVVAMMNLGFGCSAILGIQDIEPPDSGDVGEMDAATQRGANDGSSKPDGRAPHDATTQDTGFHDSHSEALMEGSADATDDEAPGSTEGGNGGLDSSADVSTTLDALPDAPSDVLNTPDSSETGSDTSTRDAPSDVLNTPDSSETGSDTSTSDGSGADVGGEDVTGADAVSDSMPSPAIVSHRLASGVEHTCAVKGDGSLWCWGTNGLDQLGIGTSPNQVASPHQVGAATTWVSVAAGADHTCGIQQDGSLWCWGFNGSGQVGNGSSGSSVAVPTLIGTAAWIDVAAGGGQTCGIHQDRSMWCWGSNQVGELGDGTTTDEHSPEQIGAASWTGVFAGNAADIGGLAAYNTCGIQVDGSLWCWGDNTFGEVGDGTMTTPRTTPEVVQSGTQWVTASVGILSTFGIQTNGSFWSWGSDNSGNLGNGMQLGTTLTPTLVGSASTWTAVAGGWGSSTCGIQQDGSLWCWGNNMYGQLGMGAVADASVGQPSPGRVGTDSTWVDVSEGQSFACGRKNDGSVWCWGANFQGELGIGGADANATYSTPSEALTGP
jgi:alpha-tubulin suppressor-like RCC1 family protein